MTIQELYNQFVKEHGCKGTRCSDCHCAFGFDKKKGTFKCIIVELTNAVGVKDEGD